MRKRTVVLSVAALVLALAPVAATSGGARRFGAPALGYVGNAAGVICTITNLGSKAVSLGTARLLLFAGDPVAPVFDECSMSPLEPFESCRLTGNPPAGGAVVDVLGDTRGLRGHCIVYDPAGVPVAESDMR